MGITKLNGRRARWVMVAATAAIACAATGGLAHGALVVEGGRGPVAKDKSVWFVPGGHACLTAGRKLQQTPIKGCHLAKPDRRGAGVIRLGSKAHYSAGALVFTHPIPAVRGVLLTYNQAQWGGSGGDGILVFLQNGDLPITMGTAVSAHQAAYLGYVPRPGSTSTGLPHALAGIALDNYGDLSAGFSNGSGCSTNGPQRPHTVVVRGPGDAGVGYCLIKTGPSVAHMATRSRKTSTHRVEIIIPPRGAVRAQVTVKVDGRLRIKLPLSRLSPASYAGPSLKTVNRFRFGFAANTGRVTDNHEIWNIRAAYAPTLQVTTTTTPRTFSRLHQILRYRFVVTNIGGDAVSNLRLRHGAFRLRGLTCAATSLVPGQHTVCTATHRVLQVQVHARVVKDKVWASGIRASGRHDASPRSSHVVRFKGR